MAITKNPKQIVNQLQIASKLMQRRIGRLPLVARFSLGLSLVLSVLVYGSIFYVIFGNQLKKDSFLEVSKCPACYGTSSCGYAKNGEVWFTGWSKVRFLDYVNVNNIHYGYDTVGRSVILSKLGSNAQIAEMESELCALAKGPEGCDVSRATVAFPASGTKWMLQHVTGISDMTTCPTERLLETMMDKYREKNDAINLSANERAQLVTTLMINQQPIVFQMFPGWPFPRYIGACGRFVMTEDVGRPLSDFYTMPWKIRAKFALRLLNIAQKLTDNDAQFSLYWTDVGYASFHVDETGEVYVVDGRHFIAVDKYRIKHDKSVGWDEPCYSVFDRCSDTTESCALSIPNRLCSAHTADHNYYAVCRNVLSSFAFRSGVSVGLLHDVPSDVEELYHIRELADRCARPEKPGQRFEVVAELVKVLMDSVDPQFG